MDIRILRYFLAVAREENMTKAAEQLHVTQPTLSKALRSLEEELGKKLFTRIPVIQDKDFFKLSYIYLIQRLHQQSSLHTGR